MAMIGGQVQAAFDLFWDCWAAHVGSFGPDDYATDAGGNAVVDDYGNLDYLQKFKMKLPVIDCLGNNVENCSEMVGIVTVEVIWVNTSINKITGYESDGEGGLTPITATDWSIVPTAHAGWHSDSADADNGQARWADFTRHFNLENVDGVTGDDIYAPFQKKAIYFLPSCKKSPPTGMTGGANFGVLAKTPVLVH
jgi:hypothetical protein